MMVEMKKAALLTGAGPLLVCVLVACSSDSDTPSGSPSSAIDGGSESDAKSTAKTDAGTTASGDDDDDKDSGRAPANDDDAGLHLDSNGCLVCPTPNAVVCDTFDRADFGTGAPTTDGWQFGHVNPPDTLATETAATCGSVFHVHLDKIRPDSDTWHGAYTGGAHLSGSSPKWSWDFDLTVDTDPSKFEVGKYAVVFALADNSYSQLATFMGVAVGHEGFVLLQHVYEGSGPAMPPTVKGSLALTAGKRSHVHFVFDVAAKTVAVTIDSAAPLSVPALEPIYTNVTRNYMVGISTLGGTPNVDARYDNYAFVIR